MFIEKRNFKNSRDLNISAIYEGEDRESSAIILCHGYGSYKEKVSTQDLAQKLEEAGFCVYRFDFTGCGQSEGNLDELTPMQGLDDLKSAVKNLDTDKFALYGSSFGGYVSLMYASQNPVLALALKAPVSDWEQVEKARTEKREYVLAQAVKIDLYQKVSNITAPTLIIHGDNDEEVPLSQSKKLFESLKCEKRLEVIPGLGHTMRGELMDKVHKLIVDFFTQNLLKNRV